MYRKEERRERGSSRVSMRSSAMSTSVHIEEQRKPIKNLTTEERKASLSKGCGCGLSSDEDETPQ